MYLIRDQFSDDGKIVSRGRASEQTYEYPMRDAAHDSLWPHCYGSGLTWFAAAEPMQDVCYPDRPLTIGKAGTIDAYIEITSGGIIYGPIYACNYNYKRVLTGETGEYAIRGYYNVSDMTDLHGVQPVPLSIQDGERKIVGDGIYRRMVITGATITEDDAYLGSLADDTRFSAACRKPLIIPLLWGNVHKPAITDDIITIQRGPIYDCQRIESINLAAKIEGYPAAWYGYHPTITVTDEAGKHITLDWQVQLAGDEDITIVTTPTPELDRVFYAERLPAWWDGKNGVPNTRPSYACTSGVYAGELTGYAKDGTIINNIDYQITAAEPAGKKNGINIAKCTITAAGKTWSDIEIPYVLPIAAAKTAEKTEKVQKLAEVDPNHNQKRKKE